MNDLSLFRPIPLLALSLCFGCVVGSAAPEDGASSSGSSEVSTGSEATTAEPTSGGDTTDSLDTDDTDDDPAEALECELPEPCERAWFYDDYEESFNDDALCVLARVRDNEVGHMETIDFLSAIDPEKPPMAVTTWIPLGDAERGVLLQHDLVEFDVESGNVGATLELLPAQRCTLKPPEFFVPCIETHDTQCRHPEDWVTDCAPLDPLVCPEA